MNFLLTLFLFVLNFSSQTQFVSQLSRAFRFFLSLKPSKVYDNFLIYILYCTVLLAFRSSLYQLDGLLVFQFFQYGANLLRLYLIGSHGLSRSQFD